MNSRFKKKHVLLVVWFESCTECSKIMMIVSFGWGTWGDLHRLVQDIPLNYVQ